MKNIIASIFLAGAAALPGLASARPVVLTTQMQAYGGDGAYLALYLADASGKYVKTLWLAGRKAKYYQHLRDWARAGGASARQVDGVTGASVGSGRTLKVTVDLADALIDAGYEIRVDSAVEDQRDSPLDARLPLTVKGAGKPVAGRAYVKSLSYDL
jgi:hypothetical protein